MPLYRECPVCRALLTEAQLTTTQGLCPYCDARVAGQGEYASPDASPDSRGGRPLAPLSAPATLGGKLATALFLLFDRFALIAGLILLIQLPANIGIELIADRNPNRLDSNEMRSLVALIDLVFSPISMAGVVTVLANRMAGLPTTFQEAVQAGVRNWGRLIVARLVSAVYILGGLLLLIVPGIILAIRYSLLDEAVVLDGAGVSESRARSSELTAGKEWKIFSTGFVAFVMSVGFYIVLADLARAAGLLDDPIARGVVGGFADVFVSFYWIVMFLFYWEAREEREYDMQLQAASKRAPADEL